MIIHLEKCRTVGTEWMQVTFFEATRGGTIVPDLCPECAEYMRDELFQDEMVWVEASS